MIASLAPSAVLPLGDNQYDNGTLAEFAASYDPTWGRFKAITHPVPGNHEYGTTGASGYFAYFGAACRRPGGKGYYSFDLGAWHLIALNSQLHEAIAARAAPARRRTQLAAGRPRRPPDAPARSPTGTSRGSPPAGTARQPRLRRRSGTPSTPRAPTSCSTATTTTTSASRRRRPTGRPDARTGIRQFVVGTGGKSHAPFQTRPPRPNSEVRNADTFGVLALTLTRRATTGGSFRRRARASRTPARSPAGERRASRGAGRVRARRRGHGGPSAPGDALAVVKHVDLVGGDAVVTRSAVHDCLADRRGR